MLACYPERKVFGNMSQRMLIISKIQAKNKKQQKSGELPNKIV